MDIGDWRIVDVRSRGGGGFVFRCAWLLDVAEEVGDVHDALLFLFHYLRTSSAGSLAQGCTFNLLAIWTVRRHRSVAMSCSNHLELRK